MRFLILYQPNSEFKSVFDTRFANQWMITTNASFNVWNWVEIYGDLSEGDQLVKVATEEMDKARAAFGQERANAVAALKADAANLSLEIAEKILRNQLADRSAQEKLVSDLLSDAKLN